MKRICCIIALVALIGCTPDAYKRSADLQVNKLLKDRESQTLGYTPKVEAATTAPATPTRKSYAKLPVTPVPTTAPATIEAAIYQLRYGPLGPEELFPPGAVSPRHEPLSIEAARLPAIEQLKLGPPLGPTAASTFDLFQAVQYAVQHSRDYQTHMEDLYLAGLNVTLERHLFEPRPFAQTGIEYTGGQTDVAYRSALNITNTAGVRQQLPLGGEIVAEGLVNFINALNDNVNDGESAQLVLRGSVPLLRGAGMVNLESLIQSERELVYQVRSFEDFRRSFAVDIATRYFQLLARQQAIANRRFNYIVLAQLTEQTNALYAAGRLSFLEVQRAFQSQLSAENGLILALNAYQSSLDDFKLAIGMAVEEPLQVVPVELAVTRPNLEEDVAALALKYRLDLQTAGDRIEDGRRGVGVAKNGLLPQLDLTARGAIANRDQTPARQTDSRNLDYSAGLNLDLPVDRVSERNAYRRSLISLERAQRSWRETRDTILSQVRDAVRSIRAAEATLEIQLRGIELARRRLDYSNELLVLGRATDSRDVVDAQSSLLSAQDAYEAAKADYQIQILQFLRDTGTLRINPQAGSLGLAMDR